MPETPLQGAHKDLGSGSFSPVLELGVGLGYLSPGSARDDLLELEMRSERRNLRQVDPPFVKT